MIHEIIPVGMLACNCSIFGDETTREAIVVDPGDDIDEIQAVLDRHQLKVKAIIITHAHIDHIGGAQKLKARTTAPILMNQHDEFLNRALDIQASWLGTATPEQAQVDASPTEGEKVMLGAAEMQFLETPGHTPGSLCIWIPSTNTLVAGDTLFRESIGRTDLPGGDFAQIQRSIRDKVLQLPDQTIIIPGHGGTTTIAHEREFNPFLT